LKLKKYFKQILVSLFLFVLILVLPLILNIEASDILRYTPKSPVLAALILLALFCARPALMFIPMVALYVSVGIIFPAGAALALTCLGLLCEMAIGYYIGKRLGGDKITALINKNRRVKEFMSDKNNSGPAGCFILRITLLHFDLVSMFFGASGVRFSQFAILSLMGSAPSMIPFVLLGDSITTPFSARFLVPFAACAAVSICAYALYARLRRRKNG